MSILLPPPSRESVPSPFARPRPCRSDRRPELHQGRDAVRIDADDDIARELIAAAFPFVGRAGGDDKDIALRNRDVLAPHGRCAGAAPAVPGTDGPPLPIGELAPKLHAALAFEHVIDLRHVVVNGIIRVRRFGAIDDADAKLMLVAPTTRLDHVHGNIVTLGGNHAFLVRLDLGSRDEGRRQIVTMTGQHQGRRIVRARLLCGEGCRNAHHEHSYRAVSPDCAMHDFTLLCESVMDSRI